MSWPEIIQTGVLVALVTGMFALFRVMYVQMVKDRDWWRDIAMKNLHLAERSTDVAEKVVSGPGDEDEDA